MNVFALEFPPVSHLFEWPDIIFSGSLFAVNKTALIYLAAVLITSAIFLTAGRQRGSLVPVGVQHVAESGVNFVEESVVMETIGPEGKKYLPFLTTMFFFILFSNIFVVRPFSLAIRLWANMVAGHLLLVTFAILTQTLWDNGYIGAIAPFSMLILMTGFEILVSVLQAFIFTILTAVYIGGSMHAEH